jgi:hypothetical protein
MFFGFALFFFFFWMCDGVVGAGSCTGRLHVTKEKREREAWRSVWWEITYGAYGDVGLGMEGLDS